MNSPRENASLIEEVFQERSLKHNLDWLRDNLLPLQVIYTDMDGTLVGPLGNFFRDADFNITLRPARALLLAQTRNVDVMLVSGRHKAQLRECARLLGCVNYVAELGTELVYNLGQEVILNIGELEVTADSVYETIVETGVVDELFTRYPGTLEEHAPWSEERDCTPLLRGYLDLEEANRFLEEKGYGQFRLLDNGVIPRISPTLDVPETRAYHLVPKGVSKEQAARKDQEHRSIPREATVAVGDAEADLHFANETGAFFMVKNGLLKNPHLAGAIMTMENVFITEEKMGLGWAELVETLLGME